LDSGSGELTTVLASWERRKRERREVNGVVR
jgi:hypothetical protein